jgi:hypothetical protein
MGLQNIDLEEKRISLMKRDFSLQVCPGYRMVDSRRGGIEGRSESERERPEQARLLRWGGSFAHHVNAP